MATTTSRRRHHRRHHHHHRRHHHYHRRHYHSPPPPPPSPCCQVLNPLGKGAFASVFKVERKSDKKIYALKRVNISKQSKREVQDAVNEIRILASIRHPHIVGFLQAFLDKVGATSGALGSTTFLTTLHITPHATSVFDTHSPSSRHRRPLRRATRSSAS